MRLNTSSIMRTPVVDRFVDLTQDYEAVDVENQLSRLPSELLYLIFDILFAVHVPQKAFDDLKYVPGPGLYRADRFGRPLLSRSTPRPCSHDLDHVAATCKQLRSQVNEWAIHFMIQHEAITKYKQPAGKVKLSKTFNALRGKGGLLTWSSNHCIFCGKTSKRSCIMMNGLRCCAGCDKTYWPDKMTKTQARIVYSLSEDVLLPEQHRHLQSFQKLAKKFPDGVPRLWYGTYMNVGVPTTMFLKKDVEWLANQYHGDLEAFMAKRKAVTELRRQRREEKIKASEEG